MIAIRGGPCPVAGAAAKAEGPRERNNKPCERHYNETYEFISLRARILPPPRFPRGRLRNRRRRRSPRG